MLARIRNTIFSWLTNTLVCYHKLYFVVVLYFSQESRVNQIVDDDIVIVVLYGFRRKIYFLLADLRGGGVVEGTRVSTL